MAADPNLPICQAIKSNGERCKNNALSGKDYCLSHSDDPEDVETRRRMSSKGGKAVQSVIAGMFTVRRKELADLKDSLYDLARDVRCGDVSPQMGATLVQVYNVLLRTIDQD